MKPIRKIISGGQTGADRAAFDFALENSIETGGFVPKNRLAEDGRISERYLNLKETKTENTAERTGLNIENSDATLILSHGELTGGSRLTKELAEKYQKPFLHVDFSILPVETAVKSVIGWLSSIECKDLNIAGPRASEDAEIYEKTRIFLKKLFQAIKKNSRAKN